MKTYVVGGAVRDELLNLPVQDRDWVVVGPRRRKCWRPGSGRSAGFSGLPASAGPKRNMRSLGPSARRRWLCRLRLSRRSRCHAEEDLARRDLTINAMARRGRRRVGRSLRRAGRSSCLRVFRHVGPARRRPVRILRLARFAARFTEFTVAPETMALMREMVGNGEVDALFRNACGRNFHVD